MGDSNASGCASRRSCSGATSSRASTIPFGGLNPSPYLAPTHQGEDSNASGCASRRSCSGVTSSRASTIPFGGWAVPLIRRRIIRGRIRTASGCASRRSRFGVPSRHASCGPTRRSESSRVIPTNGKGGLQAPFPIGRGERIRTSDLSVPNRALYQAEPRPDEGSTVPEGGRGRPALTRARGRGRPARGAGPPGGAGRRAGSRGPGGRVWVLCRGDRRGRSGGP